MKNSKKVFKLTGSKNFVLLFILENNAKTEEKAQKELGTKKLKIEKLRFSEEEFGTMITDEKFADTKEYLIKISEKETIAIVNKKVLPKEEKVEEKVNSDMIEIMEQMAKMQKQLNNVVSENKTLKDNQVVRMTRNELQDWYNEIDEGEETVSKFKQSIETINRMIEELEKNNIDMFSDRFTIKIKSKDNLINSLKIENSEIILILLIDLRIKANQRLGELNGKLQTLKNR